MTCRKNTLAADIPERGGWELGGTPFEFARMPDNRLPATPVESTEERDGIMRARVFEAVEQAGDAGISATKIAGAVKGHRRAAVFECVKEMAADAGCPVTTLPSGRYILPAEHRFDL